MTVVNTNIAETINITTNGEYNVARYTTANVNTPAAPAHYIEFNVDGNGKAQYSSQIADFTGITDIIDYLFAYQYWGNTAISGAVDMSDLTTISGQSACRYMFDGCTGITIVDLSSLTTISGVSACQYMFQYCTGITSVDLSGLTTISGNQACQYMFSDCTGITMPHESIASLRCPPVFLRRSFENKLRSGCPSMRLERFPERIWMS